ncbi:MAG: rhomboid family intramembrane serine protease [Atopobiaceae bacterium]|nr:rhomboid family intramembrane serine protease [Atopobiaceae bacterium]
MSGTSGRPLPRITFNAPVVLSFVFICVAVQVASTLTGGASTQALFTCYRGPLTSPLTYVRLVTHAFGHSSWDHLIGNMSYILLLGPLLEEKYGSTSLAQIMLISALACGIVNNVLFPNKGIVGASGIVFTFILLSSITSLRTGEIPLTFVLVAMLYIGQQVYGALFVREQIGYLSHIIGGGIGALFGFLLAGEVRG